MTHCPAAISLRFVSHCRMASRIACLLIVTALLGVGCTAVREPLAIVEPDYSYHDDASTDAEAISRLYTVPIEGKDTVAAAGRTDVTLD